MSTCAINPSTRGKRICCRLRSVDAYDQQKGLEFRWIGNRDDIEKSDDGYNSQWWSADECRGYSLCHRSETSITKFWRPKLENWDITSPRGVSGIERRRGVNYQWKAKGQCSRGDQWSFRHDGHERAKSTPKTAPSSEPPTPRGGSASRKKEPQRPESFSEVC